MEALHLLDIALGVDPAHVGSLAVKLAATKRLLKASDGSNLSETMWLKAEIAELEGTLAAGRTEETVAGN